MMIFRLTMLSSMIYSSYAFVQSVSKPVKPVVKKFNYVGDIKPLNYFDPIRVSEGLDEDFIKYVREAELHHGRVAMVSAVALPVIDKLSNKLAINWLYDFPLAEQAPFWFGVGAYELARMGAGWKNPFTERNSFFKLEDHYQPGNVLKFPSSSYDDHLLNVELSNGRLAMIGTLGYLAQELVTSTSVV